METDWIKNKKNAAVESETLGKTDDLLCLLSSWEVENMGTLDESFLGFTQRSKKRRNSCDSIRGNFLRYAMSMRNRSYERQ
ncbi:MAG: hypothetical protein DI535_25605 [Citrobacter freundii]|nr:MAG: hypothetical protein DI535_25605 [Citrobacter freundii]